HHFHTDHPVFSCSKIEQKQLNTWVSFQSAEQPLLGQFSVSGNTLIFRMLACGKEEGPLFQPCFSDAWPSRMAFIERLEAAGPEARPLHRTGSLPVRVPGESIHRL
ncbi:hypothetical protein ACIUY0_31340, partial [Pseudomonas aeruginosa]